MSRPTGDCIRAVDWSIQSVPTHGETVRFIRTHHYARGASKTSTYRHGMYRVEFPPLVGDLVGVALWIPPTRGAGATVAGADWRGVLCLSRLAIAPGIATNAASFLLGRSMRLIDRDRWPWLLTYADTARGHTGAIYKATNWTCLGPVDAADTWTAPDDSQRGRKRGSHTFKASDMLAAGCVRNPGLPKIKFVHKAA